MNRKTPVQLLTEAKAEIERLKTQVAFLTKAQAEAKTKAVAAVTTVKPVQSRYDMLWAEYQKINDIYERTRFFQVHESEMSEG